MKNNIEKFDKPFFMALLWLIVPWTAFCLIDLISELLLYGIDSLGIYVVPIASIILYIILDIKRKDPSYKKNLLWILWFIPFYAIVSLFILDKVNYNNWIIHQTQHDDILFDLNGIEYFVYAVFQTIAMTIAFIYQIIICIIRNKKLKRSDKNENI